MHLPGAIAVVRAAMSGRALSAGDVTAAAVTWPGVAAPLRTQAWGAADPRAAYRAATGTYYLTWDNCTNYCAYRQTQLSTTADPFDKAAWTHHGDVLRGASAQAHTCGASLLFRGPGEGAVAFVASGAQYDPLAEEVLLIATSNDTTAWGVAPCAASGANQCCEDRSNGGRSLPGCLSSNCCSPTPRCLAGVETPRYCAAPRLGGLAGEGCSLHLRCEAGTIEGVEFADWGQPVAAGADSD
eukprot:gene3381-3060_t